MSRRYAVLDVFTETPLEGNPLAVVLDSDGLDGKTMQKIATEFHLSETVFVLPAEREPHAAKLRIFTPDEELPFAGHPTIGTALLLATERDIAADSIMILEEDIGPIRCAIERDDKGGYVWFDAPKLPQQIDRPLDTTAIAKALGLDPEDIGFENHVPTAFDAGMGFTFVPIRNLAKTAEARPTIDGWAKVFGGDPVYVYTRETVAVARQFHARMFAPDLGIMEDPATGGAAPAFAAVISHFDALSPGTHNFIIEQGFEMDRPSLIALELDIEDDKLAEIRVGGAAVIVARGTLEV